jgi:ubiquinone/menaquinone biosynthesis C-methylase UbiE
MPKQSHAEARGLLFDSVAEHYDRVRPGYPAALVDTACSIGSLAPGSRVVEVGCGTGKLTAALVERGLRVEAVDPGHDLVEIARGRLGGASVRFHLARFEDVQLPAGAFDAVFSAAAFHWVDPSSGWTKAARLLRPGGLLALLMHTGGPNLLRLPGALAAWQEVLPEAATWKPRDAETLWAGVEARRHNVSELWAWLEKSDLATAEAAELFEDVDVAKLPVEGQSTAADVLAYLSTTSAYLSLDSTRRKLLERRLSAVLEEAGEPYRWTTHAVLVTARAARRSPPP